VSPRSYDESTATTGPLGFIGCELAWSATSRAGGQPHDYTDHRENDEDSRRDLHRAPRPLALDFAGAGVDQDAVDLLAKAISADPDRQQDVLERLGC